MSEADLPSIRRPGGLTALAILNLIFAVIGGLGGVGISAMDADPTMMQRQADEMERAAERMAEHPGPGENVERQRAIVHGMADQLRASSPLAFKVMTGLGFLGGALMLVSAFGLFGRRRWLGKHAALGAGLALFGCAGVAVATQSFLFWSFPILGAAYAVVLVAMTQTAYKQVLVH